MKKILNNNQKQYAFKKLAISYALAQSESTTKPKQPYRGRTIELKNRQTTWCQASHAHIEFSKNKMKRVPKYSSSTLLILLPAQGDSRGMSSQYLLILTNLQSVDIPTWKILMAALSVATRACATNQSCNHWLRMWGSHLSNTHSRKRLNREKER